MSIRINGTNTAANPGITGADTDTGLSFGTDEVSLNTAGTERFRVGSAGQFGIGGATYGTSGQVLTSQGSSAAPQWATPAAGGKILQVQQTVKTDTASYVNATTFADISGMSVSITPSSTSSKILILVNPHISADYQAHLRLLRGSTAIYLGDSASLRIQSAMSIYGGGSSSGESYFGTQAYAINFVDSPSTTSATTYKLQWRPNGSGTEVYFNRSMYDVDNSGQGRTASSIIAMEIGV